MEKSLLQFTLEIFNTATDLSDQLIKLNEAYPVEAGEVFKAVIASLQERNTTKTVFTVKELEQYGYLPSL